MDRTIHHPVTDLIVVALIFASVASLITEFSLAHNVAMQERFRMIGDGITWIFAVELSLRFWVAPRKGRFFIRYWVDLIALFPLLDPLRLFRVLYLFRIFRAGILLYRRLSILRTALRGTARDFAVVGVVTATLVMSASFLIYIKEGIALEVPGLEGSLWYSMFTLVGGEPIGGMPETDLGRIITLGLMLGGLTLFGVVVGTVSATMTTVLSDRMEAKHMSLDELSGHVVVLGWNRSGPTLLKELFGEHQRRRPVVVVTELEDAPDDLLSDDIPHELVYYLGGDYTRVEVLEQIGVRNASVAILLTDSLVPRSDQDRDARVVLAALTIERMSPHIFCCCELTTRQNESLLRMHGVEEIVVGDWYAGVILGSAGRNRGMVSVLDEILTSIHGNAFSKVRVPAAMTGRTIGELHVMLKREHDAVLISWEREGEPGERNAVEVNPPMDRVVSGGDILVVISRRPVRL